MSEGNGNYNRQHDAEMLGEELRIQREEQARRRQEFLNSLTEEQIAERRRQLEEGRRAARIWAETTLNGRNRANVVSDEDDRMRANQNQQAGGRRLRRIRKKQKTNKRTNKRKSKSNRKKRTSRRR